MPDENRPSADDATLAFGGAASQKPLAIPGHRVIRPLGEGGMGTVYLAEDLALGRRVAVKIISQNVARDPAVRARFLREARLLATIEHPNVVRVYSFGATEDGAYLVMEYVEGETLAERIRRGPIAFNDAKDILRKVIDAVDAAWEKRIVHRDIKPSNILFNGRGNLKVADFGLAKGVEGTDAKSDSSLTQTGYLLGSPHYVAPEQAQGHEADFRADIYSLGVTLFEMLTGRKPFEGGSALAIIARHLHEELPSVTSFRRDVGKDLADLVSWMTAKDPNKRPASYRELLDAVNALGVADETVITHRRRTPRMQSIARRVSLVTSLFCFLATIALYIEFSGGEKRKTLSANDDRLVVAVAPFWGPDPESQSEGRSMAALVQQQIVTRLGGGAKVIGIDETKDAVRDPDAARALGERLNASVVIWGQAFALRNEREIQPSLTLVPRKRNTFSNFAGAIASADQRGTFGAELPGTPDFLRVQAQATNQIELRKTSAEGIGDLVSFVAAMHALSLNDPQRALELLAQTRRTPDALYQKAVCLAQMKRDDDAARELNEALKLDPEHAPSLALLADIDARALHFADAAAHLRAAAATKKKFTTSEAALYNDVLYVKERYPEKKVMRETATMLAIDPVADRVLDRWELPGLVRVFSVDDSSMTIRYDIGPPRDGELATLRFVDGKFQGQPPPHATLLWRLNRMRVGWYYANNFTNKVSGPAALKIVRAEFHPSLIDASLPMTLPDLKAGLEKRIARDPTQPWNRYFLALTLWEMGDHAGANRTWAEMLAQPNRGTPYYEFSWMARQIELFWHFDWADSAYAEALKRRKMEVQPATIAPLIERMLDAPFLRGAAGASIVHPDPPRQYQWLLRTREMTGFAFEGDDVASDAWARYWRAHGNAKAAAAETQTYNRVRELFGWTFDALNVEDVARVTQMALVAALATLLAFVIIRRRGATALARNERVAMIAIATLLIVVGAARVIAAARTLVFASVPVPMSDNLGHPVIVASLDQVLAEHDSDEMRFITAVAHHLAGDSRRAAHLYRSLQSAEASDNLQNLDALPQHMPTVEMFVAAFGTMSTDDVSRTLRLAWHPPPESSTYLTVDAYDAAQTFFLSLLLAVALLLFALGAGRAPQQFPALRIAAFVVAVVFALISFAIQRDMSAKVKRPVSGKFGADVFLHYDAAYPMPPDRTAEEAANRAMRHAPGMRFFWLSVAAALLVAAGSGASLARDRLRRRREIGAPLFNQPVEVKA
jgi:tetratricopeptide (TPR) repeat protein